MYVILALVLLLPLVKQLTGRRRKREDSKIKKPQNVPPHRLSRTLSKTSLFAQFFSFSFFFNKTLQAKCISLHIWGSTLQHPLASLWVSVKKYTLIFSPWVKNILNQKTRKRDWKQVTVTNPERKSRGRCRHQLPGNEGRSSEKQHFTPFYFFFHRFITLDTKLVMAEAGWSGSSSANRWLMLSVVLPCFLATNPNSLTEIEDTYLNLLCANPAPFYFLKISLFVVTTLQLLVPPKLT